MLRFPGPKDRILPGNIECKSPLFTRVQQMILDRMKGSLIGLVAGDAFGLNTECVSNQIQAKHCGEQLDLHMNQWGSNTSMTLCLASSLITHQAFNPYDQLVRYKWWFKYGYLSPTGYCFGIDDAMRDSMVEFCRRQSDLSTFYGNFNEDQLDALSLEEISRSADFHVNCGRRGVSGSSALARVAPIPLLYYRTPAVAVELSGIAARITHGDDRVVDACRYLGALITAAIRGESKESILSHRFYEDHRDWFDWKDLHPSIRTVALGSYKQPIHHRGNLRPVNEIAQVLEEVLSIFWTDGNAFQKGMTEAISSSTKIRNVAAIYGQLAGALYGYNRVPTQWTQQMYAHNLITCIGEWLCFMSDRTMMGNEKQSEIQKYLYSSSRWHTSNLVDAVKDRYSPTKMLADKKENGNRSNIVSLPKLTNSAAHNQRIFYRKALAPIHNSPWDWFRPAANG